MKKIKTLKTTKILAYVLVGTFLLYLNSMEISYSKSLSPEQFIQEGKSLFEKGDYEQSLQKLTQAEAYFKSVQVKLKAERLAEIYFWQGLNFAKQGNEKISKAMFKRSLHYSLDLKYDTSLMDDATKEIFTEAKIELEKEFSPQAMGLQGEKTGKKGGSTAWIVLTVIALVAVGVLAYFLLKKDKDEEAEEPEPEPEVGSIEVNSTPEGAAIWLDGEDTGETTNETLTDVSVGSHTIELVLERYQDWEDTVTVTADTTTTVDATLEVGAFTEDFNDNVADYFVESHPALWYVDSNVYKFEGNSTLEQSTSHYDLGDFSNFTLEARGNRETSSSRWGLGIRGNSNFSVYYLVYMEPWAPTGRWGVWKYDSGSWSSIKSYTASTAINTGTNQWNKLKVVAQGEDISVYINDVFMDTVTISGIPSEGRIGLTTYTNYDFVKFDDVSLSLSTTAAVRGKKRKTVFPIPGGDPNRH